MNAFAEIWSFPSVKEKSRVLTKILFRITASWNINATINNNYLTSFYRRGKLSAAKNSDRTKATEPVGGRTLTWILVSLALTPVNLPSYVSSNNINPDITEKTMYHNGRSATGVRLIGRFECLTSFLLICMKKINP